jgi:hypothetical protein
LLTSADLAQLGYTGKGTKDSYLGAPACRWSAPSGGLGVAVNADKGLGDLNTAGKAKADVTIGSHRGVRVEEILGPGFCNISIGVGERSSVTVNAFMAGKTTQACAQAEQAARLAEPKLPRG